MLPPHFSPTQLLFLEWDLVYDPTFPTPDHMKPVPKKTQTLFFSGRRVGLE